MGIMHLIVGLFFIGIGFLVKAVPNLIAGYNTMSRDKKQYVDIEGLSTFMRNGFIVIGALIIIGFRLFDNLGLSLIANSFILISIFGGLIFIIIKSQKFNHNVDNDGKKKSWLTILILFIISLFIAGFIYYGTIQSEIIIKEQLIEITGMYGMTIKSSDINKIELKRSLPKILRRTNGFAFDVFKKGTFKLDKLGKCRLFLHADDPPYILINITDGNTVIFNNKNSVQTEGIYNKLKRVLQL